uniref:Uncharacterized protein n=1 Tax=Chromera velia CCMP2878 TaxID=1169474 RepID=A0A0G4GW49_9ALVE|eukprot:Cvel_23645.t1-p1 / transcript=Cvel_23645.t1 / gene=Cvel_23645 / organism=Chromera_velia_CCMP2878 / gene_product=hypothetical protein / transcript_product=hypothetical protein / location=Cvel_scaffold2461:850-2229(+) / protein_length=72 / sequence_SO=supercontig / SO=protein_coding / is_pseudo=false
MWARAKPPGPAVSNNSCSFAASSDQSVRALLKAQEGSFLFCRMVWSSSARMGRTTPTPFPSFSSRYLKCPSL